MTNKFVLYIMKKISILLLAGLAFVACTKHQPTEEELGMEMLNEARQLLSEGNTSAARDTIMSLRKRYPRAIDARRQAILTLDSVDFVDAQAEGDTLKIEFYRRKMKVDNKGE